MRYAFGDIKIDTAQVKLTKSGKQIECEPRVFELLVYLCQHPQEAITRTELVTQVWGGRIVSDAAVNRAVGELRKLVEERPSSPQWIKTVSKVGYQLTVIPTLIESRDEATPISDSLPLNDKRTNNQLIYTSKILWLITVFTLVFIALAFQSLYPSNKTEKQGVIGRHPVTSLMGSAFNPFYQAKLDALVFLYRADADSYAQIYMQDGKGTSQAISDDDYYYTDVLYGPDGYLYASRLNNLQQRHCEIVKIDLDSKQFSPILNCGERVVTQLAYDEKKRRLIYRSRSSISEPYSLYSYQLDTGRKQQLTHPAQKGNNLGDYVFALSADNETLAVVEYIGDGVDKIKLVNLNDNHIIATTAFIDNVSGLIWTSDSRILASNSDGLFEFDTDKLTLETKEHSDQFGRLAHGTNINSVLTERSQTTVNIFAFSEEQAPLTALTTSRGISLSPALGNRSNILAFKSNRTGEKSIYIKPETKVVFNSEFTDSIEHISGLAWSPTDDKLIASINNVLYLYSIETRHWQRLAERFSLVHHVAFVKESILFSAEVDGQWNIWQLSLDNDRVEQVTQKGGYSVQGDGTYVYFTKFNQDGLYQLNLATGIETVLIEAFPIAGWRHWQLRDNKLFYLLDKEYRELDLASGSERVLHRFKGRTPNGCSMAYQHDFFACDRVELSSSNIWQFQLSGR